MEKSYNFRRALATNSTATSFTAKSPVTTKPAHNEASGVFDLSNMDLGVGDGSCVPYGVMIVPFGTADADDTFEFQLWGWTKVEGEELWIPHLLVQAEATLSSVTATNIAANNLMGDIITLKKGPQDASLTSIVAAGDNLGAGSMIVPLRGAQIIEWEFDLGTDGNSANLMWRPLECS